MLRAPNLTELEWLSHGFGFRDSVYPAAITTAKQIHSCVVIEPEAPGDRIAEADALVTGRAGVLIGIRTADCVPVLIADRRLRAVASVHAGWRGTASSICKNAVREMAERFGSRPEDLVAAVGPSIGHCCYQVGPEVASRFGMMVTEPVHIDLPAINRRQLEEAGVRDVWVAGECTSCRLDRYFSFRKEKDQAGRMVSYIGTTGS